MHQLHKLLLISLTVFMLSGLQILQASPLHDHGSHSVDCGLCHLQLSDDALFDSKHEIAFIAARSPSTVLPIVRCSLNEPSPYQSRAPPHCFH